MWVDLTILRVPSGVREISGSESGAYDSKNTEDDEDSSCEPHSELAG